MRDAEPPAGTPDPAAAAGRGPSPDDAPSPAGLRDLLGRLAASLASAVDTRVQLAALEFAEERDRARDRLVLVLVAAIAAGFALLALNALVVAVLWDRLGWVSLALLVALWTAVAAVAVARLSQASRREQRPFSATLAEFERDRDWLVERFGRKR
ncbi:MAG: hypothetical protein RJA99_1898 [Pseudomonadota bacterium]|jgi:uncharacterized membrane protein YqjE